MQSNVRVSILLGLLLVPGCGSNETIRPILPPPSIVVRSWVATNPIQCLGNPWEQAWLEAHDGDYGAYPDDPLSPGLTPEEVEIIKDYYGSLGVTVHVVKTRSWFGAVCSACSCAAGYTLFLLIDKQDVDEMLSRGYRVAHPPSLWGRASLGTRLPLR